MELTERISILTQAAELAQKNGVLSFDEAGIAKQAIDLLNAGESVKPALNILVKIATLGQKKGIYTLRDAHFIYMASEDIDSIVVSDEQPAVEE